MGKIALALIALSASADGLGANDGSSSRDACEADCTGSGDERRCVFEARLDIHASSTGYYKFAQCGSTPQPVLAMEQGVEYTFRQKSASNWFHPLGFAYAPDGAHRGNPELEPGMTLTGSECYHSSTCQSPIYFLGNHFLGGTEDGAVRYPRLANNGDSGLYPYEPRFAVPRPDWQAKRDKADEGYKVKLTLTDEAYTKDLFYFWCAPARVDTPWCCASPRTPRLARARTAGGVCALRPRRPSPDVRHTCRRAVQPRAQPHVRPHQADAQGRVEAPPERGRAEARVCAREAERL